VLPRAYDFCREIGQLTQSQLLRKREVAPGNLGGPALESVIRDAAMSCARQASTAKMGRDAMSVVDGQLKVYRIDNLRIADASIMPRVTTGNTMAPLRRHWGTRWGNTEGRSWNELRSDSSLSSSVGRKAG
jgi:choline dehydrogenase